MSICPKCASFKINSTCNYCNIKRLKTNIIAGDYLKLSSGQKEELINHYIETLIKDTYDPKAREYREANEEPPFAHYVADDRVTCPYCKSTNTSKISTASKVAHTAMFGIFSMSRNSKQWHCNSCSSDF